jgi:hypothetical protein
VAPARRAAAEPPGDAGGGGIRLARHARRWEDRDSPAAEAAPTLPRTDIVIVGADDDAHDTLVRLLCEEGITRVARAASLRDAAFRQHTFGESLIVVGTPGEVEGLEGLDAVVVPASLLVRLLDGAGDAGPPALPRG